MANETKVVFRLLDAGGQMLGWVEDMSYMAGDGCLRASSDVVVPVDVSGTPSCVSIHWADMNVEIRVPVPEGTEANRGAALIIFTRKSVVMEVGSVPQYLPPTYTRGDVAIGMPPGRLGAVGRM